MGLHVGVKGGKGKELRTYMVRSSDGGVRCLDEDSDWQEALEGKALGREEEAPEADLNNRHIVSRKL